MTVKKQKAGKYISPELFAAILKEIPKFNRPFFQFIYLSGMPVDKVKVLHPGAANFLDKTACVGNPPVKYLLSDEALTLLTTIGYSGFHWYGHTKRWNAAMEKLNLFSRVRCGTNPYTVRPKVYRYTLTDLVYSAKFNLSGNKSCRAASG